MPPRAGAELSVASCSVRAAAASSSSTRRPNDTRRSNESCGAGVRWWFVSPHLEVRWSYMRHGDAEKGGKHDDRCRFAAAYLHRVSRCIEALSVDEVARVIDRLDEAHRAGRRVFMI